MATARKPAGRASTAHEVDDFMRKLRHPLKAELQAVRSVILHLGAKVKDNGTIGLPITGPTGLLEWLAKDRAAVKFRDRDAIEPSRSAFEGIVRQWIEHV